MEEIGLLSDVEERSEDGMRDLLALPLLICVLAAEFRFSNSLIASGA